jgi:NDP-sugar pyrophosphorylase family protein
MKGEYFLTDAFQWMIERGKKIRTAEVGGWYDCGKLETLLETNGILLSEGGARRQDLPGVTIHDPVHIADGATIERSVIGPNATIEAGATISDSTVANAIVGADAKLSRVTLDASMIGDRAVVEGLHGSASIAADSVVRTVLPIRGERTTMDPNDLIYDWNGLGDAFDFQSASFVLNDESLRDGLQSPSVIDPPMPAKLKLLFPAPVLAWWNRCGR